MDLTSALTLNESREVRAFFANARLALVGFDAIEAHAICHVLGQMGSLSRIFPATTGPLTTEIERCTAVILNLTPDLVQTQWVEAQQLNELKPPLVAVGRHDVLISMGVVQSKVCEVLIRPFGMDELVFRVWRALSTAPPLRTAAGVSVRKPRIVVADDDPSMVRLTTGLLAGQFECHEAQDGPQALRLARTLLPDLLILDVNMPRMSGFDVLKALRKDPSTSAMRVLLFTACDGQEEVRRGVELGANEYLCKPFQPFEFLKRVREYFPAIAGYSEEGKINAHSERPRWMAWPRRGGYPGEQDAQGRP